MPEQRNFYKGLPVRPWVRLTLVAADGATQEIDAIADGGSLRLQIPDVALDEELLAYGSDAVLQAAKSSHVDFLGVAGLPLLRMLEYGGDRDRFWLRSQPAS